MTIDCANCDDCQFDAAAALQMVGALPYEIHITVKDADVESFKAACGRLGVKPILLDLHTRDAGILSDLMTSAKFSGDDTSAMDEMARISGELAAGGFDVVRQKLETAPWHPLAPTAANGRGFDRGQYFESHLAIEVRPHDVRRLREVCSFYGPHLSKNAFKRFDNYGLHTYMATVRSRFGTIEDFRAAIDDTKVKLLIHKYRVDRVILEFALYDSKPSHDEVWTGGPERATDSGTVQT